MIRSWSEIRLLVGGLLVVMGTGCAGDRRPTSGARQVDTLRGVVAVQIGQLEGNDEYLFGTVIGPAMDSLGRIFVPDFQIGEVRAYGSDGQFLFTVARKGRGPGEVQGPCCLGWDEEGRLWVRDGGNARFDAYRIGADGATYERAVRFHHTDSNWWAPVTFDSAGRLVDVGHLSGPVTAPPQVVRFHVTLEGDVAEQEVVADPSSDSVDMKTVERTSSRGFVRMYAYKPFGSLSLTAHGVGGTWATAVSGYYVIRWILPDGSTRVISRDIVGPALSDAELKWAEENLAQTAKWIGTTVARLPFGMPDRKAPLQAIWFDQAGRLWVQLTRPAADTESWADVYDLSGTLTKVVRWPKRVDLRFGYVTDTVALGVTRDSLGVQRVALVRWQ